MRASLQQETARREAAEAVAKEQATVLSQLEGQYGELVSASKMIKDREAAKDSREGAALKTARQQLGLALQSAETEQGLRLAAESTAERALSAVRLVPTTLERLLTTFLGAGALDRFVDFPQSQS